MQTVERLNHAFLIPPPFRAVHANNSSQKITAVLDCCSGWCVEPVQHHGCRLALIAHSSASSASQKRRRARQLPLHLCVSSVIHTVSVTGISLKSLSNDLLKRICEWSNINDNSCGSQDYLWGVHHRQRQPRGALTHAYGPLKHQQSVGSCYRLWECMRLNPRPQNK